MSMKEYLKKYYQDNKEKAIKYAKDKRETRKKEISSGTFVMPEIKEKECNACEKLLSTTLFSFHKSSGTYHNECKLCRKIKAQQYRRANRDAVRAREKIRGKKRRSDPQFRRASALRKRLHGCFVKKTMHSNEYLNIDNDTFDEWLQLAIDNDPDTHEGLTLDNYGKVWQLDHVVPCDMFDLTDDEEAKLCFHWTNVQPLRSEYNSGKSNHINPWLIFERDYNLYCFLLDHPEIDEKEIALITSTTRKLVASRRNNNLWKVKKSEIGQSAATPLELNKIHEEGPETKEIPAQSA